MPSSAHEAMVAEILAGGLRSPERTLSREEWAAARSAEHHAPATELTDLTTKHVEFGGVKCILVQPQDIDGDVTIIYLHGGGYLWMSALSHLEVAAGLVRASGATCLSVDYRRAPEFPYPAAVDDVVAVYSALLANGTNPDTVALAGDSAGGGLVLGALVALRDSGAHLPAAAVGISPWTDLAVTGTSASTADDPIVTEQSLRTMAAAYLDGADPKSPTASPLYADLHGLPPLLVLVGTRESLLDDARRVVERARADGVDATLREFRDVVHMWVVLGPDIPESIEAFQVAGEFIMRHASLGSEQHH